MFGQPFLTSFGKRCAFLVIVVVGVATLSLFAFSAYLAI
jgi:hypothetical protein